MLNIQNIKYIKQSLAHMSPCQIQSNQLWSRLYFACTLWVEDSWWLELCCKNLMTWLGCSVIAKLETGEDDLEFIWKRGKISAEAPIPWENKSKSKKRLKELSDFYSSVPRSLLLRIYRKYFLDYEMFGYDINTALKLGGHQQISSSNMDHDI